MRIVWLSLLLPAASLAFQTPQHHATVAPRSAAFVPSSTTTRRSVSTEVPSDADITDVAASLEMSAMIAKNELLDVCRDLKSTYGILLIDTKAQETFKDAVTKLENVAEPPTDSSALIGKWRLLCTTATPSADTNENLARLGNGIDTSKLPFFNQGPFKDIRDAANKAITVEQVIKSSEKSNTIDAIDHVIDYRPPNTLSNLFKELPDQIKNININPLQVSDSKVVLKHKAEIESVIPTIKTKLSLQSIVVNVAGRSQILKSSGDDVLGINVPFGEFLNAGSFETTYMDDSIRISRSKVGIVEQIRVFIKADTVVAIEDEIAEESAAVVDVPDDDDSLDQIVLIDDDDDDGEDDISPSDVEGA